MYVREPREVNQVVPAMVQCRGLNCSPPEPEEWPNVILCLFFHWHVITIKRPFVLSVLIAAIKVIKMNWTEGYLLFTFEQGAVPAFCLFGVCLSFYLNLLWAMELGLSVLFSCSSALYSAGSWDTWHQMKESVGISRGFLSAIGVS